VHCDVHAYIALDFSPAMHAIAAEHLGRAASVRSMRSSRCRPRTRRVITATWCRCSSALAPRSACSSTPESRLPALLPLRADQPLALEQAGFADVQLCHDEGTMALWCGTNPV
jgi:hypothetical protein